MQGVRRLETSLALSALVHAAALGLLVHGVAPPDRPALTLIPIALVGGRGGGGGAAGAAPATVTPPAPSPPAPAEPVRQVAKPKPAAPRRPAAVVARRPPQAPTPAPATAPPTTGEASGGAVAGAGGAAGDGGGGGSGGGGDGSGGDGSGGARVAYGMNPRPPYPLVARRLGMEGVVLLEVLVMPDGRAADVRLAKSSGFAPLDDSAASTVRARWRFVPARRAGVAVESRVTVPIRFRLNEDSSS
jgi:protein TonB